MKHLWKNSTKLRISANRFTKAKLIIGSSLAFSTFAFFTSQMLSSSQETLACACSNNTHYDSMLPASHPQNRCALQGKKVNWHSWLSGKSGSSQFHFFDLFELLHGKRNKNFNEPNANDIAPEN